MKTYSNNFLEKVSQQDIQLLIREVSEKLGVRTNVTLRKSNFTAAELWRMHQLKRSFPVRRYF